MKHRLLQSVCIVLIFLAAFTLCLWLGVREGFRDRSLREDGVVLDQKGDWDPDNLKDPFSHPIQVSPTQIVYVTPNGAKFHLYADCVYLQRAKEVRGMLCETAVRDGKNLCSRCETKKQAE